MLKSRNKIRIWCRYSNLLCVNQPWKERSLNPMRHGDEARRLATSFLVESQVLHQLSFIYFPNCINRYKATHCLHQSLGFSVLICCHHHWHHTFSSFILWGVFGVFWGALCFALFFFLSFLYPFLQVVSQRFPQNSIGAVGSAMFLRFINPAIVSPYEAGILEKKPPSRIERGLKLMSKVDGLLWVLLKT